MDDPGGRKKSSRHQVEGFELLIRLPSRKSATVLSTSFDDLRLIAGRRKVEKLIYILLLLLNERQRGNANEECESNGVIETMAGGDAALFIAAQPTTNSSFNLSSKSNRGRPFLEITSQARELSLTVSLSRSFIIKRRHQFPN